MANPNERYIDFGSIIPEDVGVSDLIDESLLASRLSNMDKFLISN
jgi:hypothetical protein